MKNKIIYILGIFIIILSMLATNSFAVTPFGLVYGVMQSSKYALGNSENTKTLSVEVSQDATNPKKINITAQDTTYKISTIKWIEADVGTEDVAIFDTDNVNTLQIEANQSTITTSFEVENYSKYTIYTKNSHGDYFLSRITLRSNGVPTISVTKDENNKRHVTLVIDANSDDTITSLKVAKVDTIKDEVDFDTQGKAISITEGKTVTVDYTFEEDGIYRLQAKDSSGNSVIQTVYAYKEFPVKLETTISDKTINITASATLSNVNSIVVKNDATSEEETVGITPAKIIITEYEVPNYGSYTITVKDELGFSKEMQIILKEQQEQAPVTTIVYDPITKTNGAVKVTVTFDKEGVTITNNEGKNTYTFVKNGGFDFEYKTAGGLTGKVSTSVDWIDPVNIEKEYTVFTNENVNYLRKIPVSTTVENLIKNINIIDAEYKITDNLENTINKDAKLATSMKLKMDKEYKIVVTGDINGDGSMSATDVSQLKLHLVDATLLEGANFYAADMNMDNMITLTDLSQLKTKLIEV